MTLISKYAFAIMTALSMTACSSDPDTPTNEVENHDHDEPVKAVLTLTQGHVGSNYAFTPTSSATVQTITFATTSTDGWAPESGSSTSFTVSSGVSGTDSIDYLLDIAYYDAHGDLMNSEFTESGQNALHQHFFVADTIVPNTAGVTYKYSANTLALYNYTYADLASDSTTVTGSTDPIGLRGFLRFRTSGVSISMNVMLMHAATSKYLSNGLTSPFYAPSASQLQTDDFDVNMTIPFVVQ